MTNATGLVALALGGLALVLGIALFGSFSAIRRRLILLQGRAGQADILQAVARQVEEIKGLREQTRGLAEQLRQLGEVFQGALQRYSVVRYDAFEDMGGRLSFSAAFLDAKGDGIVISCINGRQEARTYAKPIAAARSNVNLSPEEQEVIRRALAGQVSE